MTYQIAVADELMDIIIGKLVKVCDSSIRLIS